MESGRYWVRVGSRTFCIEPIEGRVRSKDWGRNEGLQVAKGGAVAPEDSVITPERFTKGWELPVGMSPEGFIDDLVNGRISETDCRVF